MVFDYAILIEIKNTSIVSQGASIEIKRYYPI
jgi:hypothetical protein